MIIQTWLLPFALMAAATIIAFPLSKYLAWIMDGKYRPLRYWAGAKNAWTAVRRTGSSMPVPC